jgi:hypothetical protein
MAVFKASKSAKREHFGGQLAQTDATSNAQLLPVQRIKRTKLDSHHVFDIELATPSLVVTDIRLFLSVPQTAEGIVFKLVIKIFGDDSSLLYFNTFEEQTYA